MDNDGVEMKLVAEPVASRVEGESSEGEHCSALDDLEPTTHKPSTQRQQSVFRSKWNLIKKSVDERSQARRDATDKWVNLFSRSMSHGVSEFFGVSGAADVDLVRDKWRARSHHLHHNKLIGGRKDDAETDDRSHATASRVLSNQLTTDDQCDSFGSPQLLRWSRKLPFDPLNTMHSRQLSKISTASSGRRVLRTQPSCQPRKDSVLKMAFDAVKNLSMGVSEVERKSFVRSRSFAPNAMQTAVPRDDCFLDDVFFDPLDATSAVVQSRPFSARAESKLPHIHEKSESEQPDTATPTSDAVFDSFDAVDGMSGFDWLNQQKDIKEPFTSKLESSQILRRVREPEEPVGAFGGMRRIGDRLLDTTFVNSHRQYGVGVVGAWLGRAYRKSRMDSHIVRQMAVLDGHRPYFTYWVTFVQIVIFLFTVIVYGVTYFGFEETQVTGEVQRTNLATESCAYNEPQNMWVGPRQADLIHLGAKYSPCMRKDANVEKELNAALERERQTSCCIWNDGSGCFQASPEECSNTLSTFEKDKNSSRRTVCHQDLRYCSKYALVPHPEDFTEWPICSISNFSTIPKSVRHMKCKIIGRPCCVGIEGQCIITTSDHCEFLRGYFHTEAALCSQVPCLSEVCGMIPFYNPLVPNQFYRLWTSLFLHAGLIQLLITCLFQMIVMRDVEKLCGCLRIMIIYVMSGIAGSLSSAIFLPYHVEAGPTGSQFGILACLFVEVLQSWRILKSPVWAIGKLTILLLFLFVVGLFPWIDNYAHLVGFVFGFLLSFALFPHVTFNVVDERGKKIGIVVCLLASVGLFAGLVIMFYVSPIYNCVYCKYFNCIPLTDTFCNSMEVNIKFKKF